MIASDVKNLLDYFSHKALKRMERDAQTYSKKKRQGEEYTTYKKRMDFLAEERVLVVELLRKHGITFGHLSYQHEMLYQRILNIISLRSKHF
jgi:hypothetical protein